MADQTDVQHLGKQLMAGAIPEEGKALLDALMSGQVTSIFEKLKREEQPELLPAPERTRGFRPGSTCTAPSRGSGAASSCPAT